MPKKPDTPCAGGCGKLLWSGAGSKPAGERKCRDCRKVQPKTKWNSDAEHAGRKGRPWATLREQVLQEETHCFRCGEEVDKTLPPRGRWSPSVDHKVSIASGGEPLDRDNVALAHYGCNSSAGAQERWDREGRSDLSAEDAELAALRLAARGRRLWRALTAGPRPEPETMILIEEACRIADRLDRLDAFLSGESDRWATFQVDDDSARVTVVIDRALAEARQQQVALKQLLAELRQSRSGPAAKPGTSRRPAAGARPSAGGEVVPGVADLTARIARRSPAAG